MGRLKKPANVAIDPEIFARVEAWIKAQDAPWTRTAVFERALAEFLDKRKQPDNKERG